MGYNPAKNSLFLSGHTHYQQVGEISIPAVVNSQQLSALNTATVVQGLVDITEGNRARIGAGGGSWPGSDVQIGGLLPWNGRLLGTVYEYYDAGYLARLSHFSSGTTLATTGDFTGMFQVGSLNPGFVSGYMAPIPPAWRSPLGGKVLTGNAGIPIVSRTSLGPTASAFNPDDLNTQATAPATLLVGYPAEHPTLGEWSNYTSANPVYNMATGVSGIVFPEHHRSVLFFGSTGTGVPCYGNGTSNPALHHQPVPGGGTYCYDPTNPYKGNHAYPYVYYVWAYDAQELAQVKAGQKQAWEVRPYAHWPLELPLASGSRLTGGAGYDPTTRRIYLSALKADPGDGYFNGPLIHVLQVR